MAQQFKSGQDVTDLFEEHKSGQDVSHLFSDEEITPDSIIEDAKRPLGDEEKPKQESKKKEQSFLSKAWHAVSDPLTDAPSRFGQSISDYITTPKEHELNAADPYIRGFVGGAAKGLGDVVSSMTSPLNAALMLLGGGEFAAAKSGMGDLAQLANYGVKGASAIIGAHGASNVLSPDSTLEQRLMGIPEIAGGILGIKSRVPEISNAMHESLTPEELETVYRGGALEGREGISFWTTNSEEAKGYASLANRPEDRLLHTADIIKGKYPANSITTNGNLPESWSNIQRAIPNEELLNALKNKRKLEIIPEQTSAKLLMKEDLQPYGPESPTFDESGTAIAPPQNFPQDRPSGPWDRNIGDKTPKSGEELAYELAKEKFNMGRPLPKAIEPEILNANEGIKSNEEFIKEGFKVPDYNQIADNGTIWIDNLHGKDFGGYGEETEIAFINDTNRMKRNRGQIVPNEFKSPEEQPLQAPSSGNAPMFNKPGTKGNTGSLQSGDDVTHLFDTNKELPYLPTTINKLSINELEKLPKTFGNLDTTNTQERINIDKLKESIKKIGLVQPIEINKYSNGKMEVNQGRHRIIALKELGINEVPVKYRDMKTGFFLGANEAYKLENEKPKNIVTSRGEEINTKTGEIVPPKQPPPQEPPNNGNIPPTENTPHESSILQQAYDLPRGMISADPPFITSAAFRQGASLIGTKEWFKGWAKAAQSFGSEGAYKKVLEQVNNDPLFQPSVDTSGKEIPAYADQVGLRRTNLSDYSHREEPLRSELAEKIPLYGRYIRASNRAFTAFTNSVGNGVFKNLINDAVQFNKLGKSGGLTGTGDVVPNPFNDLPTGRAIADFVNNSLRRGKIGAEIGSHEINLEKNTKLLSNIFFSPRSISSQVRLLNPSTYAMAPPFVRKQYLGALVRQVGTWWTIAELAKLAGAQVSHDSNSADFGKIKIGNTRIDVPGGLQQFLVLGSRMLSGGSTSTNTGKFTPFGQGFKPETRASTLGAFGENRLHPTLKFAADLLGATKKQPFHLLDKSVQMIAPMYADDLMQVLNDNPDLAPIILGLSGAGMGTQTYERGSFGKPVYIDPKHDFNIGR